MFIAGDVGTKVFYERSVNLPKSRTIFINVSERLFVETAPKEIEDDRPAVIATKLLQKLYVWPELLSRGSDSDVSFDLGDGKTQSARIGALNDAADAVILITASKKDVQARAERLENIARAVVEIEFAQPSEQELEAVRTVPVVKQEPTSNNNNNNNNNNESDDDMIIFL